ncbi:hypothetical protein QBC40DRAFT_295557 [Triangularia verruculosa]|uniref:Uncharacterized protein n=1 Tax=Triangularia verruculosa TaxID=2587418 RepID=A0AAN7AW04_9PEZI|nr:hypothetical protein QBC40DRAFT_295557 [Triangularia verruculosa]
MAEVASLMMGSGGFGSGGFGSGNSGNGGSGGGSPPRSLPSFDTQDDTDESESSDSEDEAGSTSRKKPVKARRSSIRSSENKVKRRSVDKKILCPYGCMKRHRPTLRETYCKGSNLNRHLRVKHKHDKRDMSQYRAEQAARRQQRAAKSGRATRSSARQPRQQPSRQPGAPFPALSSLTPAQAEAQHYSPLRQLSNVADPTARSTAFDLPIRHREQEAGPFGSQPFVDSTTRASVPLAHHQGYDGYMLGSSAPVDMGQIHQPRQANVAGYMMQPPVPNPAHPFQQPQQPASYEHLVGHSGRIGVHQAHQPSQAFNDGYMTGPSAGIPFREVNQLEQLHQLQRPGVGGYMSSPLLQQNTPPNATYIAQPNWEMPNLNTQPHFPVPTSSPRRQVQHPPAEHARAGRSQLGYPPPNARSAHQTWAQQPQLNAQLEEMPAEIARGIQRFDEARRQHHAAIRHYQAQRSQAHQVAQQPDLERGGYQYHHGNDRSVEQAQFSVNEEPVFTTAQSNQNMDNMEPEQWQELEDAPWDQTPNTLEQPVQPSNGKAFDLGEDIVNAQREPNPDNLEQAVQHDSSENCDFGPVQYDNWDDSDFGF